MKTLLGAVAGALTVGAVLVSYNLGESHTFSQNAAMAAAYQQQMANPYLMQASQTGYVSPYAPYATPFAAQNPYGVMAPAGYPAPQFASQPAVVQQPVVRRAVSQRTYASEPVSKPGRTWQKSAMLIGGSAAARRRSTTSSRGARLTCELGNWRTLELSLEVSSLVL